ncbi:MAG: efflux RND transporter periplasmic adaptor subunit [Lacunisphaera sp.]
MALPRFVLPVVLLAAAAGGGYYYYHSRAAAEAAVPEYTTTTIAKGDVIQSVTATGQLDAVGGPVEVGSQISGQIIKLYADFNTVVKEGQKLVEIDPATYQQKLRQAEANLASAQANFKITELNANRTTELFDKSLVTQQDSDQAQALLEQARAQLLINQAAVENAKVDLSRCTIFSPIDGVVISRQTDVGKTVASSLNVPVLFTIANDLAKMQITAAVAEADIGAVSENQTVNFTVDAFPNRTFRGTVTQVRNAPKNTSNVVTYDTIISVDNRDLKLRPGMTANVSIVVAHRDGVLRAPNATLRVRMPEGLVASETPKGDKAAGTGPAAAGGEKNSAKREGGSASAGGGGSGGGGSSMRRFMGPDAPPETREKMRAIMAEVGVDFRQGPPSPEQRDQIRKLMVERGLITAEQAAEAAARSSGANGEPVYTTRTVYRLPGGNKAAKPEAVSVKVGITDGLVSEIASGLSEGDVLITSVTVPNAKPGAPATNPFGGGQRRF